MGFGGIKKFVLWGNNCSIYTQKLIMCNTCSFCHKTVGIQLKQSVERTDIA